MLNNLKNKCIILADVADVRSPCHVTYQCCNLCSCRVFYDQGRWVCMKCNIEVTRIEYRYRVGFVITDRTHTADVTVFATHSLVPLIGCSATEFEKYVGCLRESSRDWERILSSAILDTFVGRNFLFGFTRSSGSLLKHCSLSMLLHNNDVKCSNRHQPLVASQMLLPAAETANFIPVLARMLHQFADSPRNPLTVDIHPVQIHESYQFYCTPDQDLELIHKTSQTPVLLSCDRLHHSNVAMSSSNTNSAHEKTNHELCKPLSDLDGGCQAMSQGSLKDSIHGSHSLDRCPVYMLDEVCQLHDSVCESCEMPYSEDIEAFLEDLKQCQQLTGELSTNRTVSKQQLIEDCQQELLIHDVKLQIDDSDESLTMKKDLKGCDSDQLLCHNCRVQNDDMRHWEINGSQPDILPACNVDTDSVSSRSHSNFHGDDCEAVDHLSLENCSHCLEKCPLDKKCQLQFSEMKFCELPYSEDIEAFLEDLKCSEQLMTSMSASKQQCIQDCKNELLLQDVRLQTNKQFLEQSFKGCDQQSIHCTRLLTSAEETLHETSVIGNQSQKNVEGLQQDVNNFKQHMFTDCPVVQCKSLLIDHKINGCQQESVSDVDNANLVNESAYKTDHSSDMSVKHCHICEKSVSGTDVLRPADLQAYYCKSSLSDTSADMFDNSLAVVESTSPTVLVKNRVFCGISSSNKSADDLFTPSPPASAHTSTLTTPTRPIATADMSNELLTDQVIRTFSCISSVKRRQTQSWYNPLSVAQHSTAFIGSRNTGPHADHDITRRNYCDEDSLNCSVELFDSPFTSSYELRHAAVVSPTVSSNSGRLWKLFTNSTPVSCIGQQHSLVNTQHCAAAFKNMRLSPFHNATPTTTNDVAFVRQLSSDSPPLFDSTHDI